MKHSHDMIQADVVTDCVAQKLKWIVLKIDVVFTICLTCHSYDAEFPIFGKFINKREPAG